VIDPVERFTVLYDRHYRNVLGYVLLRAEQDAAEDVVSETFLVAWRRLDGLPDPVLPWLLGVARNLLYKQYHSGRRRGRGRPGSDGVRRRRPDAATGRPAAGRDAERGGGPGNEPRGERGGEGA
jgi:DNA-directed RNA polymerase specialized sigma24 family protein